MRARNKIYVHLKDPNFNTFFIIVDSSLSLEIGKNNNQSAAHLEEIEWQHKMKSAYRADAETAHMSNNRQTKQKRF